jgi:hypothetical protein
MNISFAPLKPDAAAFLTDRTGVFFSNTFEPPRWFCATVRSHYGDIKAVLACEFRTRFECSFNAAIDDPRFMSRRFLRAVFKALFTQARRITAEIDVDNRAAQKIVPRLGFVYEGYCRLGINGVRDALIFGMLKEDCKFLPGYSGGTITRFMEMPDGYQGRRPN